MLGAGFERRRRSETSEASIERWRRGASRVQPLNGREAPSVPQRNRPNLSHLVLYSEPCRRRPVEGPHGGPRGGVELRPRPTSLACSRREHAVRCASASNTKFIVQPLAFGKGDSSL